MADSLPEGHLARAPEPADVETITDLLRAYGLAVVGFGDYTEDEVRDDLAEPGFDAARDARLVFDGRGRAVGYATADVQDGSDLVDIDIAAPDPAVCQWLFAWALDRAREAGREHGHPEVTVAHGVYRVDEALRAQAEAHDFRVATTFHRMRIDHNGHLPVPRPPAGVELRVGTEPAVREAAHAVLNASFADHFGWVPKPYDTWHESHEQKSTFDWTKLWLAELDGRPVAVLVCTDYFVPDEGCGYVGDLGVLPDARGRGIAKYLLRHAFATDVAAGRKGTILHVDSNNTTPALALYESVGMRPVLVIDVWRRTVAIA